MDRELHKNICKILESGKSLSFEIDKPTQGGHEIRLSLNDKLIGEVYQYDKNLERYVNVLKGNDLEIEIGVGIQEWIYEEFFDFVCVIDYLLCDSYNDCSFYLEEKSLYLSISGVRNWDEEEESIGGRMEIKLDIE
jgi:hypothetical protein